MKFRGKLRLTRYFIAAAYSTRAGWSKKSRGHCPHHHRTARAAQRCADKQPVRIKPGVIRWWRVDEIILVPELKR